ncbi:MAG TPA: putative cytokinetic ring protein SteA [Actinopolymorphaceae bacterium]|jgi:uncharacterized membrane-anchored protein
MRLPILQRRIPARQSGVTGPARLDTRIGPLLRRLRPGDIAVINQVDLDRATAEALVAAGVAAVVNAAPSISGRYPNLGPAVLLAAGVPLVDSTGMGVFGRIRDGDEVWLDGPALFKGSAQVAFGIEQTEESVVAATEAARSGLAEQIQAFTADALELVNREHGLLLDGAGLPVLATPLADRQVLVVTAGHGVADELARLQRYVREFRPVIVAVDAGADTALKLGHRPDVIVLGDAAADSVSDEALLCGAELVVLAGGERLERLGLDGHTCRAPVAPADLAVLLAGVRNASLIVQVGTRVTLLDLLDRARSDARADGCSDGRSHGPAAFLVRLKLGSRIVDADVVQALCRERIKGRYLVGLVVSALAALLAAMAVSPVVWGLLGFD